MTLDPPNLRALLGDHLVAMPTPTPPPAHGVRFHADRIRPGDAFVALRGAKTHGLRFADDAMARGAAFVISDLPYPGAVLVDDAAAALLTLGRAARAAHRGPVVGVTGSAGKTTTKALLAAALDALSSPGNLNTPHALATILVDAWIAGEPDRPLVLELGIDHVGEMARLTDLVRPTHGLVTLVAEAHLDGLGDLATVAQEKSGALRAATVGRYAADRAWHHLPTPLRYGVRRYRVDAVGTPTDVDGAGGPGATTVGRHEVVDGVDRLVATIDGQAVALDLPGPGSALAENALGALRIAVDLGIPFDTAAARLAAARLEPGRLSQRRSGGRLLIDDSYNANPASTAAALEVLARSPRPHALVMGAMLELGSGSAERHRELGRACVERGIETVWIVGAAARPIAETCPHARPFPDAASAIAAAAELPGQGTLLVKGSRGIGLEALVRHLTSPDEVAS